MNKYLKIYIFFLLVIILCGCSNIFSKENANNEVINNFDTNIINELTSSTELYWGVKDNILYISGSKTENATRLNYSTLNASPDTIKTNEAVPWYPYPGRKYPYKIQRVIIEKSDNPIIPTSMYRWFSNLNDCTSIEGLENIDTSLVTNMANLFCGCDNLQFINVSSFNTANVQNMVGMFYYCKSLSNLDLSSFDTSNVIFMNNMFAGLSLKTLDLSSFNTSNVEDMASMFYGCEINSINFSSFDTSNVKDMASMFMHSTIDKLDLSNFNTSNVENMDCMFNWARINNLNISSFDTTNVKSIRGMFGSPNEYMRTIDVSHFDLSNAEDVDSINDLFIETLP